MAKTASAFDASVTDPAPAVPPEAEKMAAIRAKAAELRALIAETGKNRQSAAALQHIDEAVMWATTQFDGDVPQPTARPAFLRAQGLAPGTQTGAEQLMWARPLSAQESARASQVAAAYGPGETGATGSISATGATGESHG